LSCPAPRGQGAWTGYAERLHRRVVDDAHRAVERRGEVEADPALAEVSRLGKGAVVAHPPRIADGDRGVAPPARCAADFVDHPGRRKLGPRGQLARLRLAGGEELHLRAADVDGEDFGRGSHGRDRAMPVLLSMRRYTAERKGKKNHPFGWLISKV